MADLQPVAGRHGRFFYKVIKDNIRVVPGGAEGDGGAPVEGRPGREKRKQSSRKVCEEMFHGY
jgi:hypothetical protein